jgi:hypothetical protein
VRCSVRRLWWVPSWVLVVRSPGSLGVLFFGRGGHRCVSRSGGRI